MSKKKHKNTEEILALHWCKKLKAQAMDFLNEDVTPEELYAFLDEFDNETDEDKSIEIMRRFCRKHPKLRKAIVAILAQPESEKILTEIMKDLDSIANILQWERDKQIFHFDKDFTEELIRTENLTMTKDTWKYLPYQSFYVDVSDNKELCERILGKGFFVNISLKDGFWQIHLCKVLDEFYFGDVLCVPNADGECDIAAGCDTIEIHRVVGERMKKNVVTTRQHVDYKVYQMLVAQILTYLSSTEPDIHENEHTKQTYRKPSPHSKPKNKYSEIRKWDVGVRFGTAYRTWEKQYGSSTGTSGRKRTVSGKVRPHTRRAHWQRFWYGKKGEPRICRQKWVAQCFVNMDIGNTDSSPAVIHKCG